MLPFIMPLLWTLPITVGDFKGIIIYLLSLANFTSDFLKNHYILLSFYTLYFRVPYLQLLHTLFLLQAYPSPLLHSSHIQVL